MKTVSLFMALVLATPVVSFAQMADSAQATHALQSISKNGSRASSEGSAEFFTGRVRIDPLFSPNESMDVSGAYVTFEPGARSAWHTHPAGQTLVVTSGTGRTQVWGGPVEELQPGDVVNCPPGVKHWHGASPTTPMTHMAITPSVNGQNVQWMEHVSDEQYRK